MRLLHRVLPREAVKPTRNLSDLPDAKLSRRGRAGHSRDTIAHATRLMSARDARHLPP
jgi:hypothetical protein